jgi:uncharacterized OB-fold protein
VTIAPVARNESTAEFFDGTAQGQFLLRRCRSGGHLLRPQARHCSECGSTDLDWQPSSGRARLVSWALIPVGGSRTPSEGIPIVPAIVEMEEGPWWWTMVVGCDPETLREGLPLRVTFETGEGGEAVPVFGPNSP